MASEITETVLEMHFHSELMATIRDTLGLAPRGSMNFFKYSPQNETFVGFDQAYVKSTLTADEFLGLLRDSASAGNYRLANGDQFLGYFLQFKVTHVLKNVTRSTPEPIRSRRCKHFRCTLNTTRSPKTSRSQHELLHALKNNRSALVYYACPMLFERVQLYEAVDLDKLRLADVATCPSAYLDNAMHYIYYESEISDPIWCSTPTPGKALTPRRFAEVIRDATEHISPEASRQALLDLLSDRTLLDGDGESPTHRRGFNLHLLSALSTSLTILHIRRG